MNTHKEMKRVSVERAIFNLKRDIIEYPELAEHIHSRVNFLQSVPKFFLGNSKKLVNLIKPDNTDKLNLPYNEVYFECEYDGNNFGALFYTDQESSTTRLMIFTCPDFKNANYQMHYGDLVYEEHTGGVTVGEVLIPSLIKGEKRNYFKSKMFELVVNMLFASVKSSMKMLNCNNVETVSHKSVRTKKDKKQFDFPPVEYKLLALKPSKAANNTHSNKKGKMGRSKRQHIRRGHIRTLQSGKTTWVNASIINSHKESILYKDYNIVI